MNKEELDRRLEALMKKSRETDKKIEGLRLEARLEKLIQEKSHEVYRENGEAYEVVTVQDLKEAMRDDGE